MASSNGNPAGTDGRKPTRPGSRLPPACARQWGFLCPSARKDSRYRPIFHGAPGRSAPPDTETRLAPESRLPPPDGPSSSRILHRLAERIAVATFVNRLAQRQVDDPHVELALRLDGFFNGGNHDAVAAETVQIQNPQIEKIGVRRNSFEGPERTGLRGSASIAGDNSSYVSSMAQNRPPGLRR